MSRLVLWDVDGTLLKAPGLGMAAVNRALQRVVGRAPTEMILPAGMLDPNIILACLEMLEADAEAYLDAVLAASIEELKSARAEIAEKAWVLPGVSEMLAALAERGDVVQTLLTGNLRPNAVLKVGALGLDRWLDVEVGAYGEDGRERHELVPVALERVGRLRGRTYPLGDVWVIGDSENDLSCARKSGARCLLVGTGWGLPDGTAEQADAYMDDLSDTAAVLDVIMR